MSPEITVSIQIEKKPAVVTPLKQYYQYGDDYQVLGGLRGCASIGCPAVMVLRDGADTIFDRDWQFYLYAINWGMDLGAIIAILGDNKALTNNNGFGDEGDPRANYLTEKNLSYPPPRYDKFRTFVSNTHTGTETYSLTLGIWEIFSSARGVLSGRNTFAGVRAAMRAIGSTNALRLNTLDGTKPPPMRAGAPRPTQVSEIIPSDYAILPGPDTREFFLDCNNIKARSGGGYSLGPWAHGIARNWIGDNRIHTFAPFVSRYTIVSPLKNWKKIPLGSSFPSPFTS